MKKFEKFNSFERAVALMEEMSAAAQKGYAPKDMENKRQDAILFLLYDIAESLRSH